MTPRCSPPSMSSLLTALEATLTTHNVTVDAAATPFDDTEDSHRRVCRLPMTICYRATTATLLLFHRRCFSVNDVAAVQTLTTDGPHVNEPPLLSLLSRESHHRRSKSEDSLSLGAEGVIHPKPRQCPYGVGHGGQGGAEVVCHG